MEESLFFRNGSLYEILQSNKPEDDSAILDYLSSISNTNNYNKLVEYSKKLHRIKDLEWINCNKVYDIENDLKGRIVLIDFWTYCCINCMHAIPLLNQLENQFDQLFVIGVHSSKFSNEKSKQNIEHAIRRHLIKHPVVCDSNLDIWNDLQIICWPTFFVLDPNGVIIAEFQGEVQANYLQRFLKAAYKYYSASLTSVPLCNGHSFRTNGSFSSHQDIHNLSYPTKLCLDEQNQLLFVSDSGNNRVLCVDLITKKVKWTIGNGNRGCSDGSFNKCEFDWPQGLAYDSQNMLLYVADTFNDLIRICDIKNQTVRTLCGVSNKNNSLSIGYYDYNGGKKANEQIISSPWDLYLLDKDNSKVLLIACAGTHQIWLYSFKNDIASDLGHLIWWKNIKIEWQTLVCVAGNGKERNKNNSYPLQASFAQPSGLCMDDNQIIYIADAESSSIRSLNVKDGAVKGFIGGDPLQPDNLFAYGDCDGKGGEAKLQHPLDVKYHSSNNAGYLLVADTYNNSIKRVDIKSKLCHKIEIDGMKLNEPNGLFIDAKRNILFIADTNNNSIKYVENFDINRNRISELKELIIDFDNSNGNDCVDFGKLSINISDIYMKFRFHFNDNSENTCKIEAIDNQNTKLESNETLNKKNLIESGDNHQTYLINIKNLNINNIESLKLNISGVFCATTDNNDGAASNVCKLYKKQIEYSNRKQIDQLIDNNHESKFYKSIFINIPN